MTGAYYSRIWCHKRSEQEKCTSLEAISCKWPEAIRLGKRRAESRKRAWEQANRLRGLRLTLVIPIQTGSYRTRRGAGKWHRHDSKVVWRDEARCVYVAESWWRARCDSTGRLTAGTFAAQGLDYQSHALSLGGKKQRPTSRLPAAHQAQLCMIAGLQWVLVAARSWHLGQRYLRLERAGCLSRCAVRPAPLCSTCVPTVL